MSNHNGHRRSFLTGTLLILLLSFGAELTAEANVACYKIHSDAVSIDSHPIDKIMQLFFFSKKGRAGDAQTLTEPNKFFEELWNHPNFQKFLSDQSWQLAGERTQSEKYQLLAKYVEQYLSKYRNAEFLNPKEEQEAKAGLLRHGARLKPGETALQARERISSDNLKRLLGQLFLTSLPKQSDEINAVVDNLELFLSHNSHIMKEAPGLPLISPAEIDLMGLKGFGMSTLAFNRFLGSDNFVYFKALFRKKGSGEIPRSEYGENGVVLKRAYANKHALISPFVMYSNELHDSVETIAPAIALRLLNKISVVENGERIYAEKYNVVSGPDETRAAQGVLHKMDFTPEDFETLVKAVLKKGLQTYFTENPQAYQQAILVLKKGTMADIASYISYFFQHFLQYQNAVGFEGVVPVAVPEQALMHF